MNQRNTKWKINSAGILLILVVILTISIYTSSISKSTMMSVSYYNSGSVLTLEDGVVATQELLAPSDNCKMTQLMFAVDTPGMEIPGVLTVELYEDGELYETWTRDTSLIFDNDTQTFSLSKPLVMEENKSYTFKAYAAYTGEGAVSLLLTSAGNLGAAHDGVDLIADQSVNYQIGYLQNQWSDNALVLYCVVFGLIFLLKWFLSRKSRENLLSLQVSRNLLAVLAAILYITVSRLMQTIFYPSVIAEVNMEIYMVSPFLTLLLIGVAAAMFLFNMRQLQNAIASELLVWITAWILSGIVRDYRALYHCVYYVALAVSGYAVVYSVTGLTLKNCLNRLSHWFSLNKGKLLILPGAAVLGMTIEMIRSNSAGEMFLWPAWFFWTAALLCAVILVDLYRKKEGFTEKAFAVVAFTAGLCMCCLIPATTLVSWDDEIHFANTVWLAQGSQCTLADYSMIIREIGKTFSLNNLKPVFAHFEAYAQTISTAVPTLGAELELHQSIGYIPHCFGMWIGQILNLPYLFTFIMGRIGSLAAYTLFIYYGMKRMKSGKLILAVLALLPTNLFQACSYTYDGWVFSVTAFGICCFVGSMQRGDQKITKKEILVMWAALAVGIMPKGVYFPLILLLQFMPKEKFEDTKSYKKFLLLTFVVAAACFVVYLVLPLFGGSYLNDTRGGSDVNSVEQIIFILKNPLQYVEILMNFLKGYLSPENSWSYTSYMAYLNGKDFHTTLFMLMCAAALVDRRIEDRYYDNVWVKAGSTFFLFVTVCIVASVLYITFTPVAHETVLGCQPRYLAPLLFPFFILVGNFCQTRDWKTERIAAVILVIAGYVCFNSMWANFVSLYIM